MKPEQLKAIKSKKKQFYQY